MNKIARSLLSLMLLILFLLAPSNAKTILVKLDGKPALAKSTGRLAQTGVAPVDALLQEWRVQRVRTLFPAAAVSENIKSLASWVVIDFPDDINVSSALSTLMRTNGVVAAQENRAFRLHYVPNDPRYQEQYALQKISAPAAWDIERGSKDVLVAVIDTGVDYNHPDIAGQLWLNAGEDLNGNGVVDESDFNGVDDDGNGFVDDIRGWDFTDAPNYPDGGDYLERDNDPMDEHGHGTGVSGIIAAETDNELGMAGLAHHCRIMNLRSFTSSGYGEEDDVASAILYAAANGAQVINMSFGDVFVSRLLDDVIKYAYGKGVVMVASSGNSSTDQIHYPSGFAETISVGATDDRDELAGYSNYGPTVDLVAPGSSVLSLDLNDDYRSWNGTSFSAPYVSAAAALLLSHRPGLTVNAVRAILVSSADDLGDAGWDDRYGAGRLNVYRMITRETHAIAHIAEPVLDAGFSAAPIEIIGSAWSPDFDHYALSWGVSDNPQEWRLIGEPGEEPVIDGVLGIWQNLPSDEGEYALKLTVTTTDNVETQHSTRIFLDRTPPVISNLEFLPMLDGDLHSVLLQFSTDDLCEGSLFYSADGSNDFIESPLTYRTHRLRYNLSQREVEGELRAWVKAKNSAGLIGVDDNDGAYYRIDLGAPPIDVTRYSPASLTLPFGRLIGKTADFNQNGAPEIVMSVSQQGAIGPMKMYEFGDDAMQEVFATEERRIPRDIGDSDNDGKLEVLCGFGFNSFIYEATKIGDFPDHIAASWEGDGASQYWASRFADLDRDGRGEVIIRVVHPQAEGGADRFEVFETIGDNRYTPVAAFANPTSGENFNGVPHSQIGDFDGDGALEILLGDSDGDLYIHENSGDNAFTATWQDSLPLLDSISFFAAGDFDGDGVDEFVAGCHSDPNLNTEHDYDARHWYYRIYDQFGDNDYRPVAEWRIFGFESTRDYLSSVSVGDMDGDGDDEIFIAAYPDFYVLDNVGGDYDVIYHHATAQASAVVAADVNLDGRNEFWLGDGAVISAYESVGGDTGPATPAGLLAQPLDASTVKLTWSNIDGADAYRIFRGKSPDSLDFLASSTVNSYSDKAVQRDSLYFYGVQSIDAAKSPSESRLSKIVSARPGDPPVLLAAEGETRAAVRLFFSEPMNQSVRVSSNYLVNDDIRPTSVGHDKSGQEVVLSFAPPLPLGEYTVTCSNLQDVDNTPMKTGENTADFGIRESSPAPWIVNAEMPSPDLIAISFDRAMDEQSAQTPGNYSINGKFIVDKATLTGDDNEVRLAVPDLPRQAAAGDTIIVQAMNVFSAAGQSIKRGRGDVARLVMPQGEEGDGLFRVFPNPFMASSGAGDVVFANLKDNDKVYIVSSRGRSVRTLQKRGGDGDLRWDLRNESGVVVASGVYIYRVIGKRGEKLGKLAVVR